MGGACSPFSQVLDLVVVVVVYVVTVYVAAFVSVDLVSEFHHRIHPGEPTVRITERFDVQEVNIISIFNNLYSTLQYFSQRRKTLFSLLVNVKPAHDLLNCCMSGQVQLEGVLLSSLTVREV